MILLIIILSLIFRMVICPHLNSLMNLRRVVDFQFVQVFSYCEDGSDDFQAFDKLNWNSEVHACSGGIS
jgi:hypothetical protein